MSTTGWPIFSKDCCPHLTWLDKKIYLQCGCERAKRKLLWMKLFAPATHGLCQVRSAVSSVMFLLTLPSILCDGQVLRGFAQSHFNADLFKLVQCCLFVELSVRLHPLFIECFILADIASCLSSYWPAQLVAHLHNGQHSLLPIHLALKHEHNDRKTVFIAGG